MPIKQPACYQTKEIDCARYYADHDFSFISTAVHLMCVVVLKVDL